MHRTSLTVRRIAWAMLAVMAVAGCASRTPSPPPAGTAGRAVPLPGNAPVPPVPPPVTQVPPPAPVGRFADVNRTRLYYELAGPVTAETVVLIHHFTLDARMWDDQFNEFARRYRVLRYDARGFGRSGQINGVYSAGDDLRALLDALGIQRAHLVGHSMGGRYAIDFALVHPTRVRTLVLSDPSISGAPFSGAFTKEFGNAVTAARAGDYEEAKQRWLASSIFSATRQRLDVMRRVTAMVASYSGWHFGNTDPATQLQPPAAERLGRLRVPILVLVGERSIVDFHAFGDRLVREAPRVRRITLRDAGHMSNMETPAAYNRAVLEFIERPPAMSAPEPGPLPGPAACLDPKTKKPTACS